MVMLAGFEAKVLSACMYTRSFNSSAFASRGSGASSTRAHTLLSAPSALLLSGTSHAVDGGPT
jgi:hypothetical protein